MLFKRSIYPLSFLLFSLILTPALSLAGEVTFSWLPNSEPHLAGYAIHYGTSSNNYTEMVDVGLPTITSGRVSSAVSQLDPDTTYYFAATAYDADGNVSDYSDEVSFTTEKLIPPPVALSDHLIIAEDSILNGTCATEQTDQDLTFAVSSQPVNGSVSLNSSAGSFTYTPASDYFGSDSFAFTATNASGQSEPATISITITPQDDSSGSQNSGSSTVSSLFEIGELAVNSSWQIVEFNESFTNPAVVAKVTQFKGLDPGEIRIRNITSSGFEIRYQEWNYLNGPHTTEAVTFLAMEQGSHLINNETVVNAQCATISGNEIFQTMSFQQNSEKLPVIIASVTSENGSDAVTLRMNNISTQSFDIALQEQEANGDGHTTESFCYLAWEQSSGITNGLMFEAVRTDNSITHNTSTFNLKQEFTELPITLVDMQGTNGMDTAVLNQTDTSMHSVTLQVTEEQSNDTEISHVSETGGILAIAPYTGPIGQITMEAGEVEIDHRPVRVNFSQQYINPVVTGDIITLKGSEQAVLRISDVDATGFTVQVQEYDYLDGSHTLETVSYLVMEAGSYTLDNGLQVEAGNFETNATSSFMTQNFQQAFATAPVVLTSVTSIQETDTVTGRLADISTTGFNYKLQEQEANTQSHASESISYIAWEIGTGEQNSVRFEVGKTADAVGESDYQVAFSSTFTEAPIQLAAMQTTDGSDTATISTRSVTASGMTIFVEEEGSKDEELYHTSEVAGYIALSIQ